jgi:hypothetical protein
MRTLRAPSSSASSSPLVCGPESYGSLHVSSFRVAASITLFNETVASPLVYHNLPLQGQVRLRAGLHPRNLRPRPRYRLADRGHHDVGRVRGRCRRRRVRAAGPRAGLSMPLPGRGRLGRAHAPSVVGRDEGKPAVVSDNVS